MSDTDDPKEPDPKDDPDPKEPKAKTPEELQAEIDKWKGLARKHEANAKKNADAATKVAELEDADKTELQKATDKAATAEQRATEAEAKALRLEVALDKAPDGMSLAQVRKLSRRLAGGTQDELEADAEELFADFTPDSSDTDDPKEPKRRPKEKLRAGAAPDAEPEENDPAKLAGAVPRGVW